MTGHRAKLDWARKHFEALNDEINAFVARDPYRLSIEFSANRSGYVISLEDVTDLPSEWSLRVGDVVHNLRSALDAIVYRLTVRHLRRDPTRAEVKQIQFVIVDEAKNWPGEAGRRLRLVSDRARVAIERLQPYNATHDDEGRHILSTLRDLSNIDKHRHLIITLAWLSDSYIVVRAPFLKQPMKFLGTVGPVKNGTILGEFGFLVRQGILMPHKMEVSSHMTFDVAFEEEGPARGMPVMTFLASMHRHILEDIFPPLEALL